MSSIERYQIGIIGIGVMGGPIACRFVQSNFPTLVYDIDRTKVADLVQSGAQAAYSLPTLWNECTAVLICLPTASAVKEVILGPDGLTSCNNTRVQLINLSTIPPYLSTEIQERLSAQSPDYRCTGFVDAPISGGRRAAEDGTLAILVSGMKKDKMAAFPLLNIIGTPIECGAIPTSQIIKLINQILVVCQYVVIAEVLRLAEKCNVFTDLIDQVINQCLGHSKVWDLAMGTVREHKMGVQTRILAKDIVIAKQYAASLGLKLPMVITAEKFLKKIANTDSDPITVFLLNGCVEADTTDI